MDAALQHFLLKSGTPICFAPRSISSSSSRAIAAFLFCFSVDAHLRVTPAHVLPAQDPQKAPLGESSLYKINASGDQNEACSPLLSDDYYLHPFCTCRLILVYLLFTDDPRTESPQCTTHTWQHSSTFQPQTALSRSRLSIDSPTGMNRPPAHPTTPANCVTACFWPTSAHASFYISRKRRGHFSAFPFLMHRTTTSCKSLHRSSTQAIIDKYELRPHCKSSSGRRHSLCTSCHWPRDCPCDRPRERH